VVHLGHCAPRSNPVYQRGNGKTGHGIGGARQTAAGAARWRSLPHEYRDRGRRSSRWRNEPGQLRIGGAPQRATISRGRSRTESQNA
jgi:hypothetical protein